MSHWSGSVKFDLTEAGQSLSQTYGAEQIVCATSHEVVCLTFVGIVASNLETAEEQKMIRSAWLD